MIISASRRTDIPAFYSDWFCNRVKEGYVLVRNPMNFHQISRISLTREAVDCIVFWTKNPEMLLRRHLQELKQFTIPFYFQFTVTPYNRTIEPNLSSKKSIISTFMQLSEAFGSERLIWRYDPIILTDWMTPEYHCKCFEAIAKRLAPYTNQCTISFLDFYRKTQRNMHPISAIEPTAGQKRELSCKLYEIASALGIRLAACAESFDLSGTGIFPAKCIDPELIALLCKGRVTVRKDQNQRAACGCVESIDIGAYNTCNHGCLYCYANFCRTAVESRTARHDPLSPLLWGDLEEKDCIVERRMASVIDRQIALL